MASIFRRGDAWVIKWKNGAGRWVQLRTTCRTKLETQELARELERKAEFQRLGLEAVDRPTTMTFGELLDWYAENFGTRLRSKGDRISADKHLRPALGHMLLVEVTAPRIDEILTTCGDELSPKSVNNLRAFARTVFAKAIQRQLWKGTNPVDAVPRRKVPRRIPAYLKPDEVTAVLPHVPERWRALFACAIYTGMRRGELVALQKSDVDLADGTITVGRSWHADTTKGGHADVIPIHPELRPFLRDAISMSRSRLVFPREDGSMQSENVDLAELLRGAMNRAGLVDGWVHKCRRCRSRESSDDSTIRKCAKCGFTLWPSPVPRRIRFHDLRHTTATLLLKAGVPLAVVQRILRHSSPTVTAQVYGHLDLSDMSAGLQKLSFGRPVELPQSTMSNGEAPLHGAPVVRTSDEIEKSATTSDQKPEMLSGVEGIGPSRIRTWDQSVMSRQL
jgi:integrase